MTTQPQPSPHQTHEEGFALIALIVAIFVILLVLGIAAPSVARDLRREKEVESVHRANQYVRAIQLYYKKFNSYPTSIDQLEKTTNIRFLRKKYVDPLTGKADWRIIHVGENKTTVKGLFGQPLTGLAGGGLGGSSLGGATTVSGTSGTPGTSGFGSSGTSSFGGTSSTLGGTTGSTGTTGTTATDSQTSSFGGAATVAGDASSSTSSNGISGQSATGFKGSGGPIMGFGSSKSGPSIVTPNEQADYSKWEFLYDPRIEQLKARSSLFGGGGIGASTGIGGTSTPGTPAGQSGFGSSGSSTFGSPTATPTTPTSPTTTPQP